uniref:NADH-ubiquinone oxidoreductase chain 2 n=1 Tax=Cucujoidea sp. 8 KM-2017 TaxID=2219389 RepID=A0A346RG91_9CUCU|nr:NADH dehydrogenase subunit 2 [Cucujoidea sp. 8 KM-2017]
MKFYKILFFLTLIFGTMMTISAYSWFSMWMGLEINLLSIIPLMKSNKNIYPSEAAIKYFSIQTIASSMILLSIILSLNFANFMYFENSINLMLTSGLLIKMGAAPFHSWFPEVMEGMNWNNSLIILIWQKIAPMILMLNYIELNEFIYLSIIFSSMISGILGINQISLRKILAYSSINHIGWMLASMLFSQSLWLIYFSIYSIISLNIILLFKMINIFNLHQLFYSLNSDKLIKFFFSLNFLSLGGLPPFLGFMPKWLTMNFLILNNFYLLALILIIFTLWTLYFYLRITFNSLTLNSYEMITYKKFKMNKFILMFNFLSLIGLVLSTYFFLL